MSERDPAVENTESGGDHSESSGLARAARSAASASPGAPTAPGPGAPPAIGPGDCLGRYTVRSLIGAGGMGRVFAATDNELGRTVALKVIRPDRGASSYARARLQREAQALALLHHPNVVTVHDVGSDADTVFIAMELVEGPTLDAWLRAGPRTWRAIRDVFVAAGRGLAAAHAVGIVHRDFKPSNVIVGADRVVVVDFGLARADAAGDGDAPAAEAAETAPIVDTLHVALTFTGERLGTPRYMSPEQRAGEVVTARADQFAFCVALHEALFGRPPSRDDADDAGPPPAARGVPRFLAAAVARGMSPRPDDRWSSMDALLAALGRTFWTRRRKRAAGAVAAAMVAGIAALGFTAGQRAAAVAPCVDGDPLVAPLWSDAARAGVRDAFHRTGKSYADDTFARVDGAIRNRLAGWSRAYRDNCEATRVRGEQSEAMLDLRGRCLDRGKTELATLIELFQHADASTLDLAAGVAAGGDLARCTDPVALGASIAPPPPAQARDVDAMTQELAKQSPLFDLGKWKDASAAAKSLVARARTLGYKPLLARALAQQGHIEANTGPVDAAVSDLYEVAQLGTEVGDDDLLAAALPWLMFSLGDGKDHFAAADAVFHWASAAVARAGETPTRLSGLYGNRAVVLDRQGDHAGALALYHQLVDLEARRRGPDSLGVGWSLFSIAHELDLTGHGAEARGYFDRAIPMLEKAVGPDHPLVATALSNYGGALAGMLDFDAAIPVLQRSIASYERMGGPADLRIAASLNSLGLAYLGQRRLPEARAALERAIAIHRAKDASEGRNVAGEYEVLSDIAGVQGKRDEAIALSQQALAVMRKVLDPQHEEVGQSYRVAAAHLLAAGRVKDAREAIDDAVAIDDKARSKDHPEVGWAALTQGDVLRAEHQPRAAIAAYDRALAIFEQAYGAQSPGLCPVLSRLVAALLDEAAAGDAARAGPLAERDAALAARAAPDEAAIAALRLAEAHWALGVDRPAARAAARAARDRLAALPFPSEELPGADRWLTTVK